MGALPAHPTSFQALPLPSTPALKYSYMGVLSVSCIFHLCQLFMHAYIQWLKRTVDLLTILESGGLGWGQLGGSALHSTGGLIHT